MIPDHGELLYEGKAKRIYASNEHCRLFVEFKNDTTAFDSKKKAFLRDKGRLNCQISARLFEFLEGKGIPTHYLGLACENWMVVKRVEIIPLEIVLRNIATGSICRQTPLIEGKKIFPALLDLYYKDDNMNDPFLSRERLRLLEIIDEVCLLKIEQIARKLNAIVTPLFALVDLQLVDFKLEFGFNGAGELLLADEISPDTCRLWDQRCNDKKMRILDKDRFRNDLGGVIEAYGEVLKRIQEVCPNPRYYL